MKLLTDDVLLGSAVDASAIELLEEIKGDRSLPSLTVHRLGDRAYSLSALGSNVKFYYKNRVICIKKLHLP
ncbi:hypothetical protein [Tychonema sp. LEGE 07203]|uniref:hypothetical protein n=1 Tax=Tychonema sp. LEGE 07203 TaxID=1828671 RepID=UPI00187E827C|nr:hypothetical protein [Tychonema sp. LEGE 07203]MBE9094219.1 hypothetical protein [Tychonema sp. LEGE 07203]